MLHIKLPTDTMRREFFKVHTTHLGDTIVCSNLIYNMALQRKFVAVVKYANKNIARHLFDIFDYGGLLVCQDHRKRKLKPVPISRVIKVPNVFWCHKPHMSCTTRKLAISYFKLPKNRVAPIKREKPYQTCQFDSYSPSENKRRYRKREIDRAVRRFKRMDAFHVGKPGTKAYASGLPSHLANLDRQAEFLAGCQSFFGVDSGMSHLAGSLGCSGDICIQSQNEAFIACVVGAYRFMYPKMRLHRRRNFQ